MFELRTLGQLDLRNAQGEPVTAVLGHPKRLALLVYLAVDRPARFHRRDALLALFWPELDEDRARAALRKTLFHLRRALGDDVVVNRGDDDVAIDRTAITTDAALVAEAAQSNDWQRVAELYTGGFLDGFLLDDAPAFDDWTARQRSQLHGLAFDANWTLALQAEQRADSFGAAHFARRAAHLTPDDEEALRRVMAMLDRLGDRAGALAAYDDFARRLWRDYESVPAVETQNLLATIRTAPPLPSEGPATPAVQEVLAREHKRPRLRRRMVAALGIFAVTITAAVSGVQFARSPASSASARVIAVMPFAFRGQPDFSYLGDGMVNLLSTNLDHIGEFRAADAASVLDAFAENDGDALAPREAGVRALRLGAGLFVLGDVVEAGGRLRVSAALYDARRPERALARAHAEDDATRLFEVIDAITAQLVAGERRSPAERFTRLALLTTHSVPALKSYLMGERLFRAGRYNEAMESFGQAVAADTTFALGYYRLALAHMWGSSDADREAAARAIAHGNRLAGPDRALLEALLPFFRGDVHEAERQYRAILDRRPDESEVWYPLGEVLFHHNPTRGQSAAAAKPAFERALALGPRDGPLTHLLEIAALQRDWIAFDSLWTGMQRGAHFFYVGEIIQAFRDGQPGEQQRLLNALRDTSDARLATAARHMMYLMEEAAPAEQVLDLMTENGRPPNVRNWGHIHRAHLAIGSGRPLAAATELALAARLVPERALLHEAWLATLPFMATPRAELARLRTELQQLPAPPVPAVPEEDLVLRGDVDTRAHVRLYLIGLLHAQLGDDDVAMRTAGALERLGGPEHARALGRDLALAVRAEVLRVRGQPAAALRELEQARIQFDANRLNGPPFFAQVRERFVRAELLAAAQRHEEALGWFAAFDEHGPWGRAVLAHAALRQARIHDAAGRGPEAARHYARFVHLWQDAEPRFAPEVERAKRRLASLGRATGAR